MPENSDGPVTFFWRSGNIFNIQGYQGLFRRPEKMNGTPVCGQWILKNTTLINE
jgi:hypothetical protein